MALVTSNKKLLDMNDVRHSHVIDPCASACVRLRRVRTRDTSLSTFCDVTAERCHGFRLLGHAVLEHELQDLATEWMIWPQISGLSSDWQHSKITAAKQDHKHQEYSGMINMAKSYPSDQTGFNKP